MAIGKSELVLLGTFAPPRTAGPGPDDIRDILDDEKLSAHIMRDIIITGIE